MLNNPFLKLKFLRGKFIFVSKKKKKTTVNWCRFELGLEKPDPMRALQSALTIAISYMAGGLIPLSPNMVLPLAIEAVVASVITIILALQIFGFVKG